MRTMNLILTMMIAVALTAGLTACGKKKSSGSASTPGSNCSYNAYGQYVDSQGRYCNNYNGQNCLAQGYHYDAYTQQWLNNANQVVNCNDGGQWGQNGYFPYYGQYNGYYQGSGCEGWSYYYPGNQYVPISVGYGQWVCANVNWVSGYYSQFSSYYSYYGSNYFYNNPMYAWGYNDPYWGGGYGYNQCSNQLGISFSNWNFGVGGYLCF